MDDEATQPSTQQVLDPRRLGRNHSGLNENDVSDVLCILHPSSPAAFRVVRSTAERNPQHVLQNNLSHSVVGNAASVDTEEAETFIIGADNQAQGPAMDLALRFSSKTLDPLLGFCFGRNPATCDIVLDQDSVKRVSNLHFRIYVNSAGVVMLEDMSTNGTLVDNILLKGKGAQHPATQMLQPSSIIQILSPNPNEVLKFILRIPSRDGHMEEYARKYQDFMTRVAVAEKNYRHERVNNKQGKRGHPHQAALPFAGALPTGGIIPAPIVTSNYSYGMKWDGGDEYNVTGLLGKGAFAMVYRLNKKMDGQPLAAKELEKKRFIKNGQVDQRLDNEMRIMKTLRHPNIVQYIDYQDIENHLYIIMEYVPCGDLQDYLVKHSFLPEASAKLMTVQILDALAYLHQKKITHRDIKPDNILIASQEPFIVKLSDFGLSKVVQNNETFLKTFCGTLLYCAPEVFPHYDNNAHSKGTKRRRTGSATKSKFHSYSQSVDIWSFAAVLWFALCGKPPFEGVVDNTGRGMFDRIMGTRLDPAPLWARGVSAQAVDLLLKMLNTDPSQRPNEKGCMEHPWLGKVARVSRYVDADLNAIAEEEEGAEDSSDDQAEEFSQLSLNDEYDDNDEDADEEDGEAPDFDSGDFDNLDPRQSKRVRADVLVPRNQLRDHGPLDSSPEISYETSLIQDQTSSLDPVQDQSGHPRLFGEIGQSALGSSGLLGEQTTAALAMAQRDGSTSIDTTGVNVPAPAANYSFHRSVHLENELGAQDSQALPAYGPQAAASLLGAESLMRDINMMDSPQSANSPSNEPRTPKTPEYSQLSPPAEHPGSEEPTPKPPTVSSFSRQINLPIPSSFFYRTNGVNPADFENHSLMPASDVTGKNIIDGAALASALPATVYPSLTTPGIDGANDEEYIPSSAEEVSASVGEQAAAGAEEQTDSPTVPIVESSADSQFRKPPPRLGKLSSTPSSRGLAQLPIILRLENRITTWGRAPENTLVFPDAQNVHIPKRGIVIYFHALGIEKVEADGEDWTKMEGLHAVIHTVSKVGIWINGVRLRYEEDGSTNHGRIFTGDIITVIRGPAEGGTKLEFVCEFYHGEAANKRPEGETFKVLKSA